MCMYFVCNVGIALILLTRKAGQPARVSIRVRLRCQCAGHAWGWNTQGYARAHGMRNEFT